MLTPAGVWCQHGPVILTVLLRFARLAPSVSGLLTKVHELAGSLVQIHAQDAAVVYGPRRTADLSLCIVACRTRRACRRPAVIGTVRSLLFCVAELEGNHDSPRPFPARPADIPHYMAADVGLHLAAARVVRVGKMNKGQGRCHLASQCRGRRALALDFGAGQARFADIRAGTIPPPSGGMCDFLTSRRADAIAGYYHYQSRMLTPLRGR